jgi:arylsulfatase I/J
MATPDHTPHGRGYQTTLAYFGHENDYWTFEQSVENSCGGKENKLYDLWRMYDSDKAPGRPAKEVIDENKRLGCPRNNHTGCLWEDKLFESRVLRIINEHEKDAPLFIFWSTHVAHSPFQVPDKFIDKEIQHSGRQISSAMSRFFDEAVGNVVEALKKRQFYDNTLIVFSSDNGGPHNANNFPLKGGKMSSFEGGIRAAAFVSGGFIPHKVRGTVSHGLMAAWDWYATFAHLAGADPTDKRAAAADLPPIDSYNLWPFLSGKTADSPREFLVITPTAYPTGKGGLIWGKYKVVFGDADGSSTVRGAYWTGPQYPNASSPEHHQAAVIYKLVEQCGDVPENGCMYDVMTNPSEDVNIAAKNPDLFKKMHQQLLHFWSQNRLREPDEVQLGAQLLLKKPCEVALHRYGGFWGPYLS